MSPVPEFVRIEVPDRIAGLAFSYLRPAGFHEVPVPEERPDFDQPTAFFPLQVIMAGYGAVLLSLVARPAYADGTVQDWAEFLARESQLELLSLAPGMIGGLPCLLVEAQQPSEAGLMRLRTALLEDGGRLLNLSIVAPEAVWPSVEPTLQRALMSFRLAEPRGSSTALLRTAAVPPPADVARAEPSAPAEAAPAETRAAPEAGAPRAVTTSERDGVPVVSADTGEPAAPAELALSGDAATLDPEHPVNVRLRDRGAGLAPRVLETDLAGRFAVIGAGAIAAVCRVPLGWHVIDDGRRTLVFDAGGRIQLSLNLRRDTGDARALLREILEGLRSEQSQVAPVYLEFAADMPGLLVRNVRDGDTVLAQAYLVRQVRDDGLAHVARVTAAEDDMSRALNLAELVMRSLGLALAAA